MSRGQTNHLSYSRKETDPTNASMVDIIMSQLNFPLVAIPLYYVLAVIPHGVAGYIASKGNPRTHDNRNPKSSEFLAKVKSKLSAKEYARFERAESCHRNHLENMPLFVAAVLASLFVESQTGVELKTSLYTALFLGSRVLYTLNYCG